VVTNIMNPMNESPSILFMENLVNSSYTKLEYFFYTLAHKKYIQYFIRTVIIRLFFFKTSCFLFEPVKLCFAKMCARRQDFLFCYACGELQHAASRQEFVADET
jgi:hypothetical protein